MTKGHDGTKAGKEYRERKIGRRLAKADSAVRTMARVAKVGNLSIKIHT